MSMITQVSEALARFSRIGAMVSFLGAIHSLSLLLTWFSINYDNVGRSLISGYTFSEPLIISLVAGGTAGVAGILSSSLREISKIRVVLPTLSFTSAGLALFSPLYTYLVKLPSFQLSYTPEFGMFGALITGVAITGSAVLATVASIRTKSTVYLGPPPSWATQELDLARGPGEGGVEGQEVQVPEVWEETTRVETAQPTPSQPSSQAPAGGNCLICGDTVPSGDLATCKGCGATFHRDCMNVWIDLGNRCPSCNAELTS